MLGETLLRYNLSLLLNLKSLEKHRIVELHAVCLQLWLKGRSGVFINSKENIKGQKEWASIGVKSKGRNARERGCLVRWRWDNVKAMCMQNHQLPSFKLEILITESLG